MIGGDFSALLTDTLATQMVWVPSRRCPCLTSEGYADQACTVCGGSGQYQLAPSAPFMAGFIGQDKSGLQALMQPMGPGDVGDGTVVVPEEAPCYAELTQWDRLHLTQVTDTIQAVVLPGVPLHLPYGFVLLDATVKSGESAVVAAPLPTPDSTGLVTVTVATTLRWKQPRSYEVVRDLGRVRTFATDGSGLPRRFSVKRLDTTVR